MRTSTRSRSARTASFSRRRWTRSAFHRPKGGFAHTWEEARAIVEETGYPAIVRPAFTLGGTGGGTAYNPEEFEEIARNGLAASPVSQILVEESILGWKEYELEVMRDLNDNVVIICSIENFDPMGVHTGDSITVAPAQTLTDVEYQRLRDMSIACIRKVGVETGGSNIQFAVNPENGDVRIIEMNPARLALVGPRLKSDRLSDREDRGQTCGRLHARRDTERHYKEDAGVVRADDRLCRHKDPEMGVREVSRR